MGGLIGLNAVLYNYTFPFKSTYRDKFPFSFEFKLNFFFF